MLVYCWTLAQCEMGRINRSGSGGGLENEEVLTGAETRNLHLFSVLLMTIKNLKGKQNGYLRFNLFIFNNKTK